MSKKWPIQDAKSRFSELLDTTLSDGPQIVTGPDLKELLLAPEARSEDLTPPRGQHRRRTPLVVE